MDVFSFGVRNLVLCRYFTHRDGSSGGAAPGVGAIIEHQCRYDQTNHQGCRECSLSTFIVCVWN